MKPNRFFFANLSAILSISAGSGPLMAATISGDTVTGPLLSLGTNVGAPLGGVKFQYTEVNSIAALSLLANSAGPALWEWGHGYGQPQLTLQMSLSPANILTLYGTSPTSNISIDPQGGEIRIGDNKVLTQNQTTFSTSSGSSSAPGPYSVAMGYESSAQGDTSVAMGYSTALGSVSTALGSSRAEEFASTAMGVSSAYGQYSTAMGGSSALGMLSTAMGESVSTEMYATAMGNSTAMQTYSTAMGSSYAGGSYSTAMGYSQAYGNYATAMGYSSYAVGYYSTAMGQNSNASGIGSTAMGLNSNASGTASIAMGQNAYASGIASTSMGLNSYALGTSSTAAGFNARATSYSSASFGRYNTSWVSGAGGSGTSWVEMDPLFQVGNGTGSTASTASNALGIRKNGQTTLTNKAWKTYVTANPTQTLADPPATTTDSGGEALIVEGHTRLKGKVVIEVAQGDISMGIYGQ